MTAQQIVDLLNIAIKIDKVAIRMLIDQRISCNSDLMSNANILLYKGSADSGFSVGLLGILNGMANLDGECIEAMYAEGDGLKLKTLVGFRLRLREKQHTIVIS